MTETELERLVVRLTGDGSSYQRMVEQADAGNKRLEASLKKVEDAQKRADEQTKKHTSSWKDSIPVLHMATLQMELLGKAADFTKERVTSLTQTVKSLKDEAANLYKVMAESSGHFDQKGYFQKVIAENSPSTWRAAFQAGSSGIQRNLPSVMRDESTFNTSTGELEVYKRRITARQAEDEAYNQSRKIASERRGIEERYDEFGEEARQRGRIVDPTRRARAISNALDDVQRQMERLRDSTTSTTGGGTRARYERLDADWAAKAVSKFKSITHGTEDPYPKMIENANKSLEKEREELERIEALWRKIKKEAKGHETDLKEDRDAAERAATERLRKSRMSPEELRADEYKKLGFGKGSIERFETMYKTGEEESKRVSAEESIKKETEALKELAATYGLVGMKAKIALAEKRGVSPTVIASYKSAASMDLSHDGRKMLDDIRDETDEIGMTSREKRDKRAIEKLRAEGHSEETISGYRSRMEARDAAEDADELGTKVKTLVTHLEEQAEALKKNRDPMDQYTSMLSKASDAQKEMVRNAVEAVKKGELQRTGDRVTERFGDPKSRLIDEQKELKKLLDANAISADTYARAMAELARSMSSVGSASSSVSRSIDSTLSGSSEAYDRLMEFREGAFAAKGDNRGPISTTTPIAARKQKSLARMARERQIAMKKKPGKDPSRLGKDDKAGASDYWAADQAPDAFENTRFWREDGMEASKSETAGESKEDTMQVLERIAKAVEKDAEVKVSVSSLK